MRDDRRRIESRIALARGLCTYKEVVARAAEWSLYTMGCGTRGYAQPIARLRVAGDGSFQEVGPHPAPVVNNDDVAGSRL
jgi:hypothetical protein